MFLAVDWIPCRVAGFCSDACRYPQQKETFAHSVMRASIRAHAMNKQLDMLAAEKAEAE